MKTLHSGFFQDIFGNPINRNLFFIFVTTLFAAVTMVTASVVIFG